ncbi:MAG: adenylate/guanylate cyclase domain-containing protein [Gemmatimonadales bacterium]
MMRFSPRVHNRAAPWIFAAAWLFCVGVRVAGHDRPAPPPMFVNPFGTAGYPVIRAFLDSSDAGRGPFRLGDRVIRVGQTDLSGAGQLRFFSSVEDAWWRAGRAVEFEIERDEHIMTVTAQRPDHRPVGYYADLLTSAADAAAAILILTRAKSSRSVTALFYACATWSLLHVAKVDAPGALVPVTMAFGALIALATPVAWVYGWMSFPAESDSLRGWNWAWPLVFCVLGVLFYGDAYGFPFDPVVSVRWTGPAIIAWTVAIAAVSARNYRRSSPVGRRQTKWVIYATYLATLGWWCVFAAAGRDAITSAGPRWVTVASAAINLLFPIALLIAMLRYDLYDIDRLLGATLSYNLLGVVVVGGGFALVPRLTAAMTTRMDLDPSIGRFAITLALATVVILAERRLRPQVDRIFFKERFALEQAMRDLPERFAAVRRADELWSLLGGALVTNLHPAGCVIFVSAGESFVPVFSEGDALAAAMPAGTELGAWIAALRGAAKTDLRRSSGPDRALLESIGAQVIVPIHRGLQLEAFVSLGEKRSGDVYTPTDLTLLTTLAKTVSSHMLRFDEAELLERAQAMQDKMRRYVPGAVAELIALGSELETGEREVSVLFVDIRGYTAFSDGREATDIFSTVNRYTETVSTIVSRCGGVVVEFNGDGMMAVFGAPRPLADKEASAVRAARELVEAVPKLGGAASGAPGLGVGVGVATGTVFVGNIEAVDRTIWSAIGSTTNLAARLQTLTRERGAGVLIDATTHDRAAGLTEDFVRHADVRIRGRERAETLYGLPLIVPVVA